MSKDTQKKEGIINPFNDENLNSIEPATAVVTIGTDINQPSIIEETTLKKVFEKIKSKELEPQTKVLRHAYDADEKEYKKQKTTLPYACFSGIFNTRKKASDLKARTGLIVLDFDYLEVSEISSAILKLSKTEEPVLMFTSPSGHGLKVVYKIQITEAEHPRYFKAIENYLYNEFGLIADPSGKDIARACFLAYDPNAIYNPNAKTLSKPFLDRWAPPEEPKAPYQPKAHYVAPTEQEAERVLKIAEKIVLESTDGEKHTQLLKAATLCGGYIASGVLSKDTAIYVLEEAIQSKNIDSYTAAQRTIRSGIQHGEKKPLYIQEPTPPRPATKQTPHEEPEQDIDVGNIPIYGMPAPAQEIIQHYAEVFGTPIDLWSGAFISAVATAVGGGAELKDKYTNPPIFWMLLVAFSGTGKSEPQKQFFGPLHKRDMDSNNKWTEEAAKYLEYKKLSKAEKAETTKIKPPPPLKQIVTGDTTPEALVEIMSNNPKGIIILKDEFNGFLKDITRYNKNGHVEFLTSSFGQEWNTTNRKGKSSELDSGLKKQEKPILNIFGGIQDGLLHELATEGKDVSGFLARFLYVYPPKFNKPKYNDTRVSEEIKRKYVSVIDRLFILRDSVYPEEYHLTEDAKNLYRDFYNNNCRLIDQCNKNNEQTLATLYSKLDYYAYRFAVVFHCLKWAINEDLSKNISAETMKYAIDVCEYFRRTGQKAVNEINKVKPPVQTNKELAIILREKGLSQTQIAKSLNISQPAVNKILKGI